MRWFNDLSGVLELLADPVAPLRDLVALCEAGVPVAVDMGGESTHERSSVKRRFENSSQPRGEVKADRACWTVCGPGFRRRASLPTRARLAGAPASEG
jgi:hypothetical protein